MATYSHVFGSQFPNQLITPGSRKDVDAFAAPIIRQYYSLFDNGDTDAASDLLKQYEDILEPYIVNIKYINRLEEEINNIGIAVLSQYTVLNATEEPDASIQDAGSYWIQEYE